MCVYVYIHTYIYVCVFEYTYMCVCEYIYCIHSPMYVSCTSHLPLNSTILKRVDKQGKFIEVYMFIRTVNRMLFENWTRVVEEI